ncbi:phosphopantetheine-binding protein [Saccharopolyspora sp. NFXS83]|uniref:acyl carrier protein n=1 Tax=Saccharopolyspora sp. NFXS83 TaxID=2993560 RepID=UPI00224B534C|nr:phosphopantetheine-binding protein [Saccharopolyspora sp. NFXS83]MCX2731726.1 phosphopantetheine-binding protein [Saccharopolyspora sp. NFXS83]
MVEKLISRVGELLTSRFEVAPDDVSPDASFDDLGLDSLAQVELGEILEQNFGIEVSDEEMEKLATLADLAELLKQKGVAA